MTLRIAFVAVALALAGWAEAKEICGQAQVKACSAEAMKLGLTGDARRAYMKKCLSGDTQRGAADAGPEAPVPLPEKK